MGKLAFTMDDSQLTTCRYNTVSLYAILREADNDNDHYVCRKGEL